MMDRIIGVYYNNTIELTAVGLNMASTSKLFKGDFRAALIEISTF